jgi:outer membrane cobalamin receptor
VHGPRRLADREPEARLRGAARYEKFSDFGSAKMSKITGRCDFSPKFALRSTISNGFRAPTMAEQYYSSTSRRLPSLCSSHRIRRAPHWSGSPA